MHQSATALVTLTPVAPAPRVQPPLRTAAVEHGLESMETELALDVRLAPESASNLVIGLDGGIRGVFVATFDDVEIGTRVRLTVHLPGVSSVHAIGDVEWVRWSSCGAPPGLGVRFASLSKHDADVLQCFAAHREPVFHEL